MNLNPFAMAADVVTWKFKAIALLVILTALTGATTWFMHHEREIGRDEIRAERTLEHAQQKEVALEESIANAKETQRRLERQKGAQDAYDQDLAHARADADGARTAADGLRQRAEQLARAARGAAGDRAAGVDGKATRDPAGMLADVLGRVVERAQRVAEYADAARAAGLQCERDYDALRTK
jgi:hypothetical protein